jgi:hypothetical protein
MFGKAFAKGRDMRTATKSRNKQGKVVSEARAVNQHFRRAEATTGIRCRTITPPPPTHDEERAVQAASDIEDLLWWSSAESTMVDLHRCPTRRP